MPPCRRTASLMALVTVVRSGWEPVGRLLAKSASHRAVSRIVWQLMPLTVGERESR
ncbi:hypothetical protein AMIS_49800 [Actinoplanes missouriensis 431]|uniref:Uncharacterized protein n=1 Tax=Actinoplanes missouriensis (strain ATCC 14538 / DSM 43046 / CBS 188.64 / JCM 3121 / NBRC 102363 / NCIMB 12654 / NRRL B-3342 / UNCC 431) TaxID=512565 RepID=I0HB13_ACTM4|nr:hypothetical protein AMIS_49800 [Actinoplanes missouriensis 431]